MTFTHGIQHTPLQREGGSAGPSFEIDDHDVVDENDSQNAGGSHMLAKDKGPADDDEYVELLVSDFRCNEPGAYVRLNPPVSRGIMFSFNLEFNIVQIRGVTVVKGRNSTTVFIDGRIEGEFMLGDDFRIEGIVTNRT